MTAEFLFYVLAGFVAQMIDGALGMAYGVTASSILIGAGVSPAAASATVHAAECFTTGASALSHKAFGNVSGRLFKSLLLPGVVGAALGAYVLAALPGERLKPFIAGYLFVMGAVIVCKAYRQVVPRKVTTHLGPLAFFGAMVDAIGGGGWGPIVASNLAARGNAIRETIGSVNAVEFFVTLSSSIVFVVTLGFSNWQIIAGLALGGLVAAPIGAWACKKVPHKPMMVLVGLLIMVLSVRTIWKSLP